MRKLMFIVLALTLSCNSYQFSNSMEMIEDAPSKIDPNKPQYYTIITSIMIDGKTFRSYLYAGPFHAYECGVALMTAIGMTKMSGALVTGSCSNDVPPGWNDPIVEKRI